MRIPVYLDHHATTPIDPIVLDAMMPYLKEDFGNSHSSTHSYGWRSEQAVEKARGQIAASLGASTPSEIVITSGATESNNLALFGVMRALKASGRRHMITTNIEHKAILDSAKHLEREGVECTYLAVDKFGLVTLDAIRSAIRPETGLISIMAANNEIGTVNPIREIGSLAREKGVYFHTDGVQGVGKIPLHVENDFIDLLSLSAHKVYGPKGVGALYVRRKNPRVEIEALQFGGGHERGLRSGTLNTPGIVGLGKAMELLGINHDAEALRLGELREHLFLSLKKAIPDLVLNGPDFGPQRLYNNLNISIPYVAGESMLAGLREIAISTGSACNSSSGVGSYVLQAIGRGVDHAKASLRFGLGRFNTREEIDFAVEKVTATVTRLRDSSPLYQLEQKRLRG
jgi:cysteine desulfurase